MPWDVRWDLCVCWAASEEIEKGLQMLTREEIFARIQQVLIDNFEVEEKFIAPDTHLFKDLDLDSFDAIDLAVVLEVNTGMKLKEEDMRSMRTISDIVEIVYKKINNVSTVEK